jgi:hypothetical protein
MPLKIPFNAKTYRSEDNPFIKEGTDQSKDTNTPLKKEYEQAKPDEYEQIEYNRPLRIPFSHELYNRLDQNMNLVGTNSHTAKKSYRFINEVDPYYYFSKKREKMN